MASVKTSYNIPEAVHVDVNDPVIGPVERDIKAGQFVPKDDLDVRLAEFLVGLGAATRGDAPKED